MHSYSHNHVRCGHDQGKRDRLLGLFHIITTILTYAAVTCYVLAGDDATLITPPGILILGFLGAGTVWATLGLINRAGQAGYIMTNEVAIFMAWEQKKLASLDVCC